MRRRLLTADEIAKPFVGSWADQFPPILSPADLAALIRKSRKTVYEWIERGRLDGAIRKRGKHILIWRDKALDILFNASSWSNDDE